VKVFFLGKKLTVGEEWWKVGGGQRTYLE